MNPYNLAVNGLSGNGSGWIDGEGTNEFSFADIALKLVAEQLSNLVMCKVSNGDSVLAIVENVNGSWSTDYENIPVGTPKLLQELENRYNALISYCNTNNITVNVKGFIWHQGERDYTLGYDAQYASNFSALVAKVRNFTGVADLPVFYGTISEISTQYSLTIKNAQLAFAVSDDNAYCRDNSALTLISGEDHFDATSSKTFGEWVADMFSTNYL